MTTAKTRRRRATDTPPQRPSPAHTAFERDSHEQELAARRMGGTREERLHWVVTKFAAKDLEALRPDELRALGYDLRQLLSPPWGVRRKRSPLPSDEVRRIQREVVKGLRILTQERRATQPEEWELPPGTDRLVPWVSGDGTQRKRKFAIRSEGDEYTAIIRGVAYLILMAGEDLRACAQCHTPFVGVKRQAYCTTACSQQARDQRKREKGQQQRG